MKECPRISNGVYPAFSTCKLGTVGQFKNSRRRYDAIHDFSEDEQGLRSWRHAPGEDAAETRL
jgi:hypothetical protein